MTTWRMLGLLGTLLFAGRWVIQVYSARRAGASHVTPAFWLMSLAGSILLVIYFALGPHADPVGFVGNFLPLLTASYNLHLILRHRRGILPNTRGAAAGHVASWRAGSHEGRAAGTAEPRRQQPVARAPPPSLTTI